MKSLIYAQASCDETVEWVEYVRDCHEDLAEEAQPFLQELDELGRKLNRFTQAVERGHRSPK